MFIKRNCLLIGQEWFMEKLRFLRLKRNWENVKAKGGKLSAGLGTGGKTVFWMCHVGCIEKLPLDPDYGIESWMKGKRWKRPEKLLWKEKTVTRDCACSSVGEAGWLRTWTPGPVFLGSDFNLGLTTYGAWPSSLSFLSLSFCICTTGSNRVVIEFRELIVVVAQSEH